MTIVLSRASFAGTAFPVTDVTIISAHRFHVHEYPHTDGGDLEKLGRKLDIVRMSGWFHELSGIAALNFPGLWPAGIQQLCAKMASGTTEDLVVPGKGIIRAFPTAWTRKLVFGQAIDGEKVDFEFCEDLEDDGPANNEFELAADSMVEAAAKLDIEALLRDYKKTRKPGIFEQINDAVGAVQAARDQVGLASSMVAAKVEAVKSLCEEAERTVDFMGSADAVPIAVAVRNLWNVANDVAANLIANAEETRVYVVPEQTNVMKLSMKLYGTTDKVGSLLKLNAFPDAYAIGAGTQLIYVV